MLFICNFQPSITANECLIAKTEGHQLAYEKEVDRNNKYNISEECNLSLIYFYYIEY